MKNTNTHDLIRSFNLSIESESKLLRIADGESSNFTKDILEFIKEIEIDNENELEYRDDKIDEEHDELQTEIDRLEDESEKLANEIVSLEEEIDEMKISNEIEVEQFQEDISLLEEKISNLQKEINNNV